MGGQDVCLWEVPQFFVKADLQRSASQIDHIHPFMSEPSDGCRLVSGFFTDFCGT